MLSAIRYDIEVLKTTTDDDEKRAALKFLGHWVGDINQPLHVSFADDRAATSSRQLVCLAAITFIAYGTPASLSGLLVATF